MRPKLKAGNTRAALLLALLLSGCAEWVVPVVPPAPPGPSPVSPVDPSGPVVPVTPPTTVATFEAVSSIAPGQDLATITTAVGFAPTLTSRQDDGTTTARWPCVNATGEARWCVVTFDPAGKAVGHVLIPRAT